MTRLSKLLENQRFIRLYGYRRTESFKFASFMIRIRYAHRAFLTSKRRTNMATQNFGQNAAALLPRRAIPYNPWVQLRAWCVFLKL